MDFLLSFFSGVEREHPVIVPLPLKIGLYVLWFGVMVLIFVFRHCLSRLKKPERIAKAMGVILLVDQIVLYSWQFSPAISILNRAFPFPLSYTVPLLILDRFRSQSHIQYGFIGRRSGQSFQLFLGSLSV